MGAGFTTVFSPALEHDVHLSFLLPEILKDKYFPEGVKDEPWLIYCLHGYSSGSQEWIRKSQIEEFTKTLNAVFIFPDTATEFYSDSKRGLKYGTFLMDELPVIVEKWFGIKHNREKTLVMGLSMGGYGALKWAFSRPEYFGGCGSFAPVVDLANSAEFDPLAFENLLKIFGSKDAMVGTDADVFQLVNDFDKQDKLKMRLYHCCGEEDFLYAQNLDFNDFVLKHNKNLTYTFETGPGLHNWLYWNQKIVKALSFLGCDFKINFQ